MSSAKMSLEKRIERMRTATRRQLYCALLLTLASMANGISSVLNPTRVSIISGAVILACTVLVWTIYMMYRNTTEILQVMQDELPGGS